MLRKSSCQFIIDFSKSACQFKLMKTDFQHQRHKHLVQSVFEQLLFDYEADCLTHFKWANQSRSISLALGMLRKSSCQFVIYFSKSACQFKLMKTDFQHQRHKHLANLYLNSCYLIMRQIALHILNELSRAEAFSLP